MLQLAEQGGELSRSPANVIIDKIRDAPDAFSASAKRRFPGEITEGSLRFIQSLINDNVNRLR